jgi:hypothetical protein
MRLHTSEDRPPFSWWQLGEMLCLGGPPYDMWREAPWLRFTVSETDPTPRVKAFELFEVRYAELLNKAVEHWLQNRPLPTLNTEASYLLGLCFQVVGNLLMSFADVGSLMPPAPDDEIGISRKFLIDWWRKNGANYAVGSTCAELKGLV